MVVQPVFIFGTINENGTDNFAPITWVSATQGDEDKYLLVISMFGSKTTKKNVIRTGVFSVNLVNQEMLPLMDYFGTHKAKDGQKNAMIYGDSTTFFCYIRNIQIDSMSPLIEKDRKELLKILE